VPRAVPKRAVYDKSGEKIPITVTGSARLDLYRKGSDSLLGRYLPYRLHPFTVAETATPPSSAQILDHAQVSYPLADLLALGGFPEPLLGGKELEARRWSRLRIDRLVLADGKPWMLVECKSGAKEPSNQLRRFVEMLKPKYQVQLVLEKMRYRREYPAYGVTVIDYESFFAGLM